MYYGSLIYIAPCCVMLYNCHCMVKMVALDPGYGLPTVESTSCSKHSLKMGIRPPPLFRSLGFIHSPAHRLAVTMSTVF